MTKAIIIAITALSCLTAATHINPQETDPWGFSILRINLDSCTAASEAGYGPTTPCVQLRPLW